MNKSLAILLLVVCMFAAFADISEASPYRSFKDSGEASPYDGFAGIGEALYRRTFSKRCIAFDNPCSGQAPYCCSGLYCQKNDPTWAMGM